MLGLFALFVSISWAEVLNDNCLGCICETSTGCNRTIGCNDGLCGAFGISFDYWKDAGAPVHDDKPENYYQDCANDLPCAADTVRNYMSKYQKDCNNDSKIDCKDFAHIHYSGAGCEGKVSKEFLTSFNNCLKTLEKMKLNV